MKVPATSLLLSVLAFGQIAFAGSWYKGTTGELVGENDIISDVKSGQVLLMSELHDSEDHHQNQRDLMVKLSGGTFPISTGMEFFDYTKQNHVDDYGLDKIDEQSFLKLVGWGKINFDFYRFQVRLPYYSGGRTYGLNIPRAVSSQVAKGGLESLTEEQKKFLPPNFTLGSDTYLERFREVMGDHVPKEKIMNYFTAQSLWDDTMAWRAALAMQENPNQLLVVIVGDFHVAYQDGLVARLRARGAQNILSVSQVDTSSLKSDERKRFMAPHERYGARADYIYDTAAP